MNILHFIRGLVYIDIPAEAVLATLKLAGIIDWPWAAILAPTWIPSTILTFAFVGLLYLNRARIIDIEIEVNIKRPPKTREEKQA